MSLAVQVTVLVPASLRQYSGGLGRVPVAFHHAEPLTVGDVLERLHADHPGVVERALDESGQVRQHVNIFVDGQSIRAGFALGLQTPVATGAEVWILPAVSGG